MKILALDISSVSTGYCVFNNGRLLKSSLGIITTKSKDNIAKRLDDFRKDLVELIHLHNPDTIICEEIFRGRNIITFKVLACFRGVALQTVYEITKKYPISVMASAARKLVGSKNTKEEAFGFVTNKYATLDLEFEKHNDIADAIVLGLAAHTMHKQGIDEKTLSKTRRSRRKKRKTRKRKK